MPRVAKKQEVEAEVEVAPAAKKPRASAAKKVVEDEPAARTRRTRRTKTEKDPNAPKKPMNAYMLFANDYRLKHSAELKSVGPVTEQGRHLGQLYKNLKPAELEKWKSLAAKEKADYEKKMVKYTATH